MKKNPELLLILFIWGNAAIAALAQTKVKKTHQVSDSVEKIDFEQMEKIARTIFATGWELANRPTRPKVDEPLQTGGN